MADSNFPTLISKDRNVNAVANVIFVQLSDGTNALSITGNALDVNVDNTVTVSASDLDIRDLVAGVGTGEDNILIFANTVKDGSGTDYVPLVDGDGHLQMDVLTLPAITNNFTYDYNVDDASGLTDTGAMILAVRDDALTTLTPVDGDYVSLRVDSTGKLWTNTTITTTETTPLYVYVVNTVVSGYEVHNYDTQSALAADTPDNHDYPVTGATFLLKQVTVSSSGGCKIEVQTGPVATLATIAVGFIPKHGGTWDWTLAVAREVPVGSTGTVRVIRTNREGSAQDVYSTIIGNNI